MTSRALNRLRTALCLAPALLMAACAGGPPPADWQMNAQSALTRSVAAYLEGNTRIEAAELALARSEIARSGRPDVLARAELLRCAAHVASLVFEPCAAFAPLQQDAAQPERAYADYLAGHLQPQDVALLPASQRAAAGPLPAEPAAVLKDIADPLSRLVAAGVLFQTSRASPAVLAQAVETASAQGWRRPLLAWLGVQLKRTELAGDKEDVDRLQRRIELVTGGTSPR